MKNKQNRNKEKILYSTIYNSKADNIKVICLIFMYNGKENISLEILKEKLYRVKKIMNAKFN